MERAESSQSNAHVINIEGSGVRPPHDGPSSGREEVVSDMLQIIAAVVVLAVSRHEKPQKPLFGWVIGYMVGCVALLPSRFVHYYRRRRHQVNQSSEKSYFVGDFPIVVECFFGVWFIVGCVWLRHTSLSDAPILYWTCVVFLTITGMWLAGSIIKDYYETMKRSRGEGSLNARSGGGSNAAAGGAVRVGQVSVNALPGARSNAVSGGAVRAGQVSVNALPAAHSNAVAGRAVRAAQVSVNALPSAHSNAVAAGVVGIAISAENEDCSICLAKIVDGVALRVLPCSHMFHKECVDEWLQINASCPLCKYELGSGHHL